jgi:hypothetical protein
MMSNTNHTIEGFQVKTTVSGDKIAVKTKRTLTPKQRKPKSERYTITTGGPSGPYYGGPSDELPDLPAIDTKPSAAERVAAMRASYHDHGEAFTSLFDAHALAVTDDCLDWKQRFAHALMLLSGTTENGDDGIELLDSICAAAARKVERKDRDVAKAVKDYRDAKAGDTETEIGRALLADAEDRVNDRRDAVERWDAIRQIAEKTYEAVSGNRWQDRSTGVAMADVGDTAQWERQLRLTELMKKFRVFVTGGNEPETIAKMRERLAETKAKVGERLHLLVGESDRGFDAEVRKWCEKNNVSYFVIPLADRNKPSRYFDRNRLVFDQLKPNGCLVLGGGGVQGNVIELSQRTKTKVAVEIPPTGWAVNGERGLHRVDERNRPLKPLRQPA